jgi:hypothetical protein
MTIKTIKKTMDMIASYCKLRTAMATCFAASLFEFDDKHEKKLSIGSQLWHALWHYSPQAMKQTNVDLFYCICKNVTSKDIQAMSLRDIFHCRSNAEEKILLLMDC